jgi:transposase InsO family protein
MKKIVGYCLHQFLSTEGCLKALEMALTTRTKKGNALIHHSDRGVQYCSFEYVKKLKSAGICISMTDSGEAYENLGPDADPTSAGPLQNESMAF